MKALTFFHEGNEIAVHNNLLGVETVKYNGEKMTSHFSLFGSTHNFSVLENNETANYQIKIAMSMMLGVTFSIWRNEKALLLGAGWHKPSKVNSTHSEYV